MKTQVVVLLVAVQAAVGVPVVLYDVNFDGPPHVVGQQPATGTGAAPRNTPSAIPFGDPRVQSSLGAMYRPLVLNSTGSELWLEQVEFGIAAAHNGFTQTFPYYRTELDFLVDYISGNTDFRVHVDAPNAHQVRLVASGDILAIVLANSAGYEQEIGHFVLDQVQHLAINTDIANESWSIALNGQSLFTGGYPSTQLDSVRITVFTYSGSIQVGVDNVKIVGLPEPALCVPLAPLAVLAVRTRRR